jgi:hypothetical protein
MNAETGMLARHLLYRLRTGVAGRVIAVTFAVFTIAVVGHPMPIAAAGVGGNDSVSIDS